MRQVPGFGFRAERGGLPEPIIYGKPGLVIASLHHRTFIQALRIRDDDPHAKNKYTYVSSSWAGGPSPGAPVHVSFAPGEEPGHVARARLGEGELKAYYSAHVQGVTMIALPGVTVQKGIPEVVRAIDSERVDMIFDADAATNSLVLRSQDAAAVTCAALGRTVFQVTWDTSPGPEGKPTPRGFDDAGRKNLPLASSPYPFRQRSGHVERIPADALPRPAPTPMRHIREARAELMWELDDALEDIGIGRPRCVQILAGTGVGKTRAVTDKLTEWFEDGWPTKPSFARGNVPVAEPMRVVILCVTNEACQEVAAALPPGLAIRQEGRNPDRNHPWGCLEPDRTSSAGASRHNPRSDVCATCIEINGWAKTHPECNYLRSRALLDGARVVVAPAAAYFNGSSGLDAFDLVIFDEGLFPFLIEEIAVDGRRCAEWRERMNQIDAQPAAAGDPESPRYPIESPFRRLVDALDMVQAHRPETPQKWEPAMATLREACPDLPAIVRAVRGTKTAKGTNRYACETPILWEERGKRLVPLRALRDISDAIHDEIDRDERADTRLWLTQDGFVLLRPRRDILETLRSRKVINLDATPHAALRFFFPDAQVIRIDAPAHQRVVQVTDLLGTGRELTNPDTLARVQAALAAIHARHAPSTTVVFGRKSIMPGGADDDAPTLALDAPGVQYGWFDNHTRGLNKYQEADLLVIVGRHTPPIDRIRAEVMAARFSPDPAPRGGHLELLRYEWRSGAGSGSGRVTRADNDPDVNAAVRQLERASILQAIGRGRGVNRNPDNPLLVYLLSSLPIEGLPIHELTTLTELGGAARQRGANAAFRQQSSSVAAQSAHVNADCRARVAAAVSAMKADGSIITATALAKRAGVHRDTLYADEACRAMLDRARAPARITNSVGAGTDNELSLCDPAPTLDVIDRAPPIRGARARTFRPHPAIFDPPLHRPPGDVTSPHAPPAFLVVGD